MKKTAMIASLLLAAALAASAQPQGGPPPEGGHRGPPPEALEACKASKAGADCSVTLGNRTMKGSCQAPEGRALACRPKDMPPPPEGGASGTRPAK
jgi:hypothetical protein